MRLLTSPLPLCFKLRGARQRGVLNTISTRKLHVQWWLLQVELFENHIHYTILCLSWIHQHRHLRKSLSLEGIYPCSQRDYVKETPEMEFIFICPLTHLSNQSLCVFSRLSSHSFTFPTLTPTLGVDVILTPTLQMRK